MYRPVLKNKTATMFFLKKSFLVYTYTYPPVSSISGSRSPPFGLAVAVSQIIGSPCRPVLEKYKLKNSVKNLKSRLGVLELPLTSICIQNY